MYDTEKRSRTVIIQSRVDPRSMATLAMYFQKEYDIVIATMSGLVNQVVEELRSLVVEVDPEIDVKETLEAFEMLQKLGCDSRMAGKEFLIQQQKEAGVYTSPVSTRISRSLQRRQEGRHAEMMENLRKQAQRLIDSGEIDRGILEKANEGQSREDALSRARGAGIIVDPDEPVGEGVETEEEAQARREKELEEQKSELGKRPEVKEVNENEG